MCNSPRCQKRIRHNLVSEQNQHASSWLWWLSGMVFTRSPAQTLGAQPRGLHLDLLWELWRQHGHSSHPAPLCTDPQSPRLLKLEPSKLQEPLLSFGVFTGAEFSKPSLEVSLLSSHSTQRDFPPVP